MLGTLLLGADAAEATVFNVTGTAGADSFATVEAALAEAESLAEAGELNAAGVKIVLSANQTATVDENGILFGQKMEGNGILCVTSLFIGAILVDRRNATSIRWSW